MNNEKINIWDIGAVIVLTFVFIAIVLLVSMLCFLFAKGAVNGQEHLNDKNQKLECYEIYVEDNVILKRCEKYFKDSDD